MTIDLEKKIEALESRNAFQDDAIEQLNHEITKHCCLQILVNIREEFCEANEIVYKAKKTVCMLICPKSWSDVNEHPIYLYNRTLNYVTSYKYLGVYLCNNMSDEHDIRRQIGAIYSAGNMLKQKFVKSSPIVKVELFRSYLSSFYCSHLWSCYRESTLQRLKVAYNNSFRFFLGIRGPHSISNIFVSF